MAKIQRTKTIKNKDYWTETQLRKELSILPRGKYPTATVVEILKENIELNEHDKRKLKKHLLRVENHIQNIVSHCLGEGTHKVTEKVKINKSYSESPFRAEVTWLVK